MTRWHHAGLALLFAMTMAGSSTAQTQPPQNTWSHGTTLDLFAGVATASSRTGPALGGGLGWEMTPRLALHGSLQWLDRPGRADAFAADLTVQYALRPPATLAPFLKGGLGLYRISFDSPLGDLPAFYRRRLGGGPGPFVARTFTDPSFVVGGGARYFATRQWSLQPEVTATIVRRESRSHVVTSVALRVGYHFEEHPITPSRRPEVSR